MRFALDQGIPTTEKLSTKKRKSTGEGSHKKAKTKAQKGFYQFLERVENAMAHKPHHTETKKENDHASHSPPQTTAHTNTTATTPTSTTTTTTTPVVVNVSVECTFCGQPVEGPPATILEHYQVHRHHTITALSEKQKGALQMRMLWNQSRVRYLIHFTQPTEFCLANGCDQGGSSKLWTKKTAS